MIQLTSSHVVALALAAYWAEVPARVFQYVDREDIAVKTDLVSPGRFAWRKYPDRIDLEAVCTALRRAKKVESGQLVVGDNSNGWLLSVLGVAWVMTAQYHVQPPFASQLGTSRQVIRDYLATERLRLGKTAVATCQPTTRAAFSLPEFYEFALINEYFEARARARRYCIVESAVAADDRLSRLWQKLKASFPTEMDV